MKRQINKLAKSRPCRLGLVGVLFLLLAVAVFQSCNKKDFDFTKMTDPAWTPTWNLPLVNSNLSLHDILKSGKGLVIEDPVTHMLTIEYDTTLLSQGADQYLLIPDQTNIKLDTTLTIFVPPTSDSIRYKMTIPYSFATNKPGQRFDSIFMKTAALKIDVTSFINHTTKILVSLPSAKKDGKIFETALNLDYPQPLPVNQTLNLDLSGYKLSFNNAAGHKNEITAIFDITIYSDGDHGLSNCKFVANSDITNIKFSKIFGYFGQYDYPLKDTLKLGIFTKTLQGSIKLKEIDLFLTTINSLGMPIQLNFVDLKAYSPVNSPYTVNIADHIGFPNPILIPSPDIESIGTVADTTVQFGDNNSNIIDAINMAPEYIYFNVQGKSNPTGNAAYENFVLDTSRFSVGFRVVLPLFGSISGFVVQDTVAFIFDIPKQADMLAFKVRTENHFPLDADLQIYFADQNYKILDSLFTGADRRILVAAPVGGPPDYRVDESQPVQPFTFSPAPFLSADLDQLRKAKFLMIKAKMSTYNSSLVKIYADYLLDVRLAAKIQLNTQN